MLEYDSMNILLPNFIVENPSLYLHATKQEKFIAAKSIIHKKGKLHIRITTHMMILIKNGEKILHLEQEDRYVDQNQFILMAQGNYFMSEIVGKNKYFETIIICFDDTFVMDFLRKNRLEMNVTSKNRLIVLPKDDSIHACIDAIERIFESDYKEKENLLKLKTEEIFLYAFSNNPEKFMHFLNMILSTSSTRNKYILEANIDILHNITDMCKVTHLSESSLRKEILRFYNSTPKKWLDSIRMQKAETMLKNSDHSISYIATSCGYSNVSWFINQFKKYYKSTPLLYRKENSYK